MTEPAMNLQHQGIARQLSLVPTHILDEHITIVGAGAVGSWVALGLAKSGFKNLAIFDHDEVDIVNMSCQFYGVKDIGKKKVEALAERILEMTGESIMDIPEKWNGMKMSGIVVMAADSMEARKQIFEAHVGNHHTKLLIDARMGAETALIYTVNPNDEQSCKAYSGSLHSDAEGVQERCSAKSTTYCAITLSGLIIKCVRDALMPGKLIKSLAFSLKENDWICFSNDLRPQPK